MMGAILVVTPMECATLLRSVPVWEEPLQEAVPVDSEFAALLAEDVGHPPL